MQPPLSRTVRLRQAVLARVTDTLRAWAYGDDLAAAEARDAIDALLDDEINAAIRDALSEIRESE
jgi:hypothetical protein